jgi:MFS transporter, SHS family, lactate transporter
VTNRSAFHPLDFPLACWAFAIRIWKRGAISDWTTQQKHVVAAGFLGWSLDAFDFFLLVFVLKDIAAEFGTDIPSVTTALLLTLATRPIGAFLFGRAADRWGRRPTLMVDIFLYSILEFASGFAPNLTFFIILRALYGVAMGGEWGVGASLTMETVPASARGFASGVLQAGYPAGYFVASVTYGLLFPYIGWRGLFMVGVLPTLLVLYIRRKVPESPGFDKAAANTRGGTLNVLRVHWRLALYAVALMTAFNFFSHGTQDLYPTFLEAERNLSPQAVSIIAVVYNVGAICGSLLFGSLSERCGRRRCIVAAAIMSLLVLPLWALSTGITMIAISAFLMQFAVQGAWGVIPVHLNELSPDSARGTFPGVVYQLGNFLASVNAPLQAMIAVHFGDDYWLALTAVTGTVAIVIALLTAFGSEAKGVEFAEATQHLQLV